MKVKYIKEAAGVKAGEVRELPEALANALINKGVAEKANKPVVKKEETTELKTKENKQTSKRKTKSKK